MARTDYDRDLRMLQDELLVLGSIVEKAIARSMDALKRRDMEASLDVIKQDDVIDEKQTDLEERCVDLIATQQPLAGDLRILLTVLHVSVELERIGDYAEGISKISLLISNEPSLSSVTGIPRMAELSSDMLRRSLDALVNRDIVAARGVWTDDDEMDELYEKVVNDLLNVMMSDASTIRRATHLLWVAHDLERIADRTTNIAERIIYLVTGKPSSMSLPNDQDSK